jgi:all-trans-retinol 13,14-reductase
MTEKFPGEGDVKGYYDLEERIEARVWSWVVTKLLPAGVPKGFRESFYGGTAGAWRKYMQRTTAQVLQGELGFSNRLASIFSYMFGNYGATPENSPFALHAINMNHYRTGSYYPVGGPGQIAECIIPTITDAGGQLAVSSKVARILVENGRAVGVKLESGEEIRSNLVISDVGAYPTFVDLLDPEVSNKFGYPSRFDTLAPSPGHGWLTLGYDEHIDLPKHIIWAMACVPGKDPYDISGADAIYKKDMNLDGMGAYILCPSARDPSFQQRYPGKSTVMILCETSPEWNARGKTDPKFKAELSAKLDEKLYEITLRHIPALRGKTPKYRASGFPVGCNPWSWKGGSYGLAPTKERFLGDTHWTRPQTEIQGLYLTGQDAFAPGFVGAMMGGRVCYSVVTGEIFNLITKSPGRARSVVSAPIAAAP